MNQIKSDEKVEMAVKEGEEESLKNNMCASPDIVPVGENEEISDRGDEAQAQPQPRLIFPCDDDDDNNNNDHDKDSSEVFEKQPEDPQKINADNGNFELSSKIESISDKSVADVMSEKVDFGLPDVVPNAGKPEVETTNSDNKTCSEILEVPLRSVLKKDKVTTKKNLRVTFNDTPMVFVEPEPLPSLMLFLDSNFELQLNVPDWNDEEIEISETAVVNDQSVTENPSVQSSNDEVSNGKGGLTIANLIQHNSHPTNGDLESDTDSDSSQDTIILMTSAESKRNQELIKRSQCRFQNPQEESNKDSGGERPVYLRSNHAVRKCLERAARRRTLTQCAKVVQRKTRTSDAKVNLEMSTEEKLRLLTRDSSEDGTEQRPRLDLQEVRSLISTRRPLHVMYSSRQVEQEVPGDVRQWKIHSKLWERQTELELNTKNNNLKPYSSTEDDGNYEDLSARLDEHPTGCDELEEFVQQDWERIERVRQRYSVEEDRASYLEWCRRPSVRGIRPRFGSTTQIFQRLQQQRQPPPILDQRWNAHHSWPRVNRQVQMDDGEIHENQLQKLVLTEDNAQHWQPPANVNGGRYSPARHLGQRGDYFNSYVRDFSQDVWQSSYSGQNNGEFISDV